MTIQTWSRSHHVLHVWCFPSVPIMPQKKTKTSYVPACVQCVHCRNYVYTLACTCIHTSVYIHEVYCILYCPRAKLVMCTHAWSPGASCLVVPSSVHCLCTASESPWWSVQLYVHTSMCVHTHVLYMYILVFVCPLRGMACAGVCRCVLLVYDHCCACTLDSMCVHPVYRCRLCVLYTQSPIRECIPKILCTVHVRHQQYVYQNLLCTVHIFIQDS